MVKAAPIDRREPPRLVLYTRSRCHLCDVAKADLQPFVERLGLRIEERDVEERPEWETAHGTQVPVGFVGQRKAFKYRVDPVRLARLLGAEERRHD